MKDPRFREDALRRFRAERRRKAEGIAVAAVDIDAIRNALAAPLATTASWDPTEIADAFEAGAAAVAPEARALLETIVDVLRKRPPQEGALRDRAELMLGDIVGSSLAHRKPSPAAFDGARQLVSVGEFAQEAFDETFVEVCRGNAVLLDAWCPELATLPHKLDGYVMSFSRRELSEEYARKPYRRPTSAWHDRGVFVPLAEGITYRLWLLKDLSPVKLIEVLEEIPFPPIRRVVMEYLQLHENRELLLSLISLAPKAYSGDEWTGKVTPFLLIEEVIDHATRLFDAVERQQRTPAIVVRMPESAPTEALSALCETELPEWFRGAFDTILARPDGPRLAIELGVELIRRTSHRRTVGREPSWDGIAKARDILVDKLIDAGVAREAVRRACRSTAAGDTTFGEMAYVLLSALIDYSRASRDPTPGASGSINENVWSWYEERLLKTDSEIGSHLNPYAPTQWWVFAILGAALYRHADIVATWVRTWDSLFCQRERARFDHSDFHVMDSSRHALWGGLYGVLTMKPHEIGENHRALWRSIRARAEYLLSSEDARLQHEAPAVCRLFSFVPHVMGVAWPTAVRESIGLFRVDDEVCLTSAHLLVLNGVDPASVRKEFVEIGCDPVDAGRRLQAWIAATNQKTGTTIDVAACLRPFEGTNAPGTT